MALKFVSGTGFLIGIALSVVAIAVRQQRPKDPSTTPACDLLLAVASILALGSASVYTLIP